MALDKDAFVGVHELDGAGTTGIACKKLGYDFIGIELDSQLPTNEFVGLR